MKQLYLNEKLFNGSEEEFLSIEKFDIKTWVLNGKTHRVGGPAAIWLDGYQTWCQNGKLHRDDGPAVIFPNGSQKWLQNGLLHREDGPAVIYSGGYGNYWYIEGFEFCEFFNKFFPNLYVFINNTKT